MNLKLGAVQFHHRANDKAYNLAVIERFALDAAAVGVKILAFPEMCITGYWHVRNLGRQELDRLAEPVPEGASIIKTMALARELDIAIGVGLIECTNDRRLFNSYVFCQPDGTFACHRKLHAFENRGADGGRASSVTRSYAAMAAAPALKRAGDFKSGHCTRRRRAVLCLKPQ